jgi:hypothetical protein
LWNVVVAWLLHLVWDENRWCGMTCFCMVFTFGLE